MPCARETVMDSVIGCKTVMAVARGWQGAVTGDNGCDMARVVIMMTSSNGNISALLAFCEGNPPVTGGFPLQRPVTWSFDVFFDVRMNKRLSKQSRCRWFKTPWRSLLRHCNDAPAVSLWQTFQHYYIIQIHKCPLRTQRTPVGHKNHTLIFSPPINCE